MLLSPPWGKSCVTNVGGTTAPVLGHCFFQSNAGRTFVQFLHGWIRSCNVPFEMKCRNVSVPLPTGGKGGGPLVQMKPKDALLQHVANAAKRQAELMAQARSQGWEMKRLARIEIERKRRAIEKQSEKENSEARKELALTEKSDRIAAKAANMQKFEAERR